jgi:hypothetical protein
VPGGGRVRLGPRFALMGETTTTEGVLDYIMRLKFVTLDGRGARMTRLGRIVLANSAEIEDEADQPKEILLAADDEWALRDIIRTVRNSGECLIVDPYCREPQLNELVRYTPVTRVLVGQAVAGEGFDLTLGRVRPPRTLEVRVSDAIHDRHVIPDSGPVLAFGMSLNGIGGRKPTIVVTLSADLSRRVLKKGAVDGCPWRATKIGCRSIGPLRFPVLVVRSLRASDPVIPLCFRGFRGKRDRQGDGTANENGWARWLMVGRWSMSRP